MCSMTPFKIEFLCLSLSCLLALSIAREIPHYGLLKYGRNPNNGRLYFEQIGQLYETYLPVTINVPDMLSALAGGFGSVYEYFMGGGSRPSGSSTPRIWDELLREIYVIVTDY